MGKFKGLVRIINVNKPEPLPFDLQTFLKPQAYKIRVYCLDAFGVQPHDSNGKSDPYLKVSALHRCAQPSAAHACSQQYTFGRVPQLRLGKTKISDAKNYIKATNSPEFFRCFEMATTLPGPSTLSIDMYDHDMLTSDDLIGKTIIDLEDRWFDSRWQVQRCVGMLSPTLLVNADPLHQPTQAMGQAMASPTYLAPKPVERRPFWIPTATTSQVSAGCAHKWALLDTNSLVPVARNRAPCPCGSTF